MFHLSATDTPTDEQIEKAAAPLKKAAIQTLMATPPLRKLILDLRQKFEQIVDEVSKDTLLPEQTGYSPEARQKAEALVKSFESYLAEHKDEIDALQFFYSVPHKKRLRFKDIQALANAISSPPRSWTTEKLWRAYETLEKSKVRGASAQRLLTDIVSLVRFALHQDGELVPHADRVRERFQNWLAQQANKGRTFSDEQIPVARHDARPHRDESGDRHGQLRPDPFHERRWLGAGVEGLRQGAQGHRAGIE